MMTPSENLVTMLNPDSVCAEAFRILRTNLTLRDFDKKMKVINVVSTTSQESKSTTLLNLAYVYSQLDKHVLVIDCDLRLPSVHKKLNLRNKAGITNVIANQVKFSEAVIRYGDNLDVLLSGTKIPFAAEFVQSAALGDFIQECRKVYDIVLIDCPPVGLVTDGVILSTYCDGTIVCCACGKNEKKDLLKTKDILDQMNVNVLGVVMTRMPVAKKNYDYHYGYHSGYATATKKKTEKKGLFLQRGNKKP